jgi:hypothetical protein
MDAPPLIKVPDVPQVLLVVAVAELLALFGPLALLCSTVTVMPLTLMPLPLQMA